MNAKEIIEGNKLIAEFMGYIDNGDPDGFLIDPNTNYDVNVDELKFHSSWDWLMPVVEKIQSLRNDKDIDELDRIHITALEVSFKNLPKNGYTKIEDMWQAVIEFIKWYNEK